MEYTQPPIHFSLTVWAKDKETNMIPGLIIPSIRLTTEEISEFGKDGLFQKAYDAYKEFVKRNNPNLDLVGETK